MKWESVKFFRPSRHLKFELEILDSKQGGGSATATADGATHSDNVSQGPPHSEEPESAG